MKSSKQMSNRLLREKKQLKAEVERWINIIKVEPKQIRVQRMVQKWASCSSKGWVSFNIDLIHEPQKFRDCVIIHELLHLRIPNHGKLFKSMLNAYLPEWEQIVKVRNKRIATKASNKKC